MTRLTSTTLIQSGVKNIVDELRSNLDSANFTNGSVYSFASFPKKPAVFPLVVTRPPEVNTRVSSFGNDSKTAELDFEIHVYAKNAKTVDLIGDDVIDNLTTDSVVQEFSKDNSMHYQGYRVGDQSKIDYGGFHVYDKTINVNYEYWGT